MNNTQTYQTENRLPELQNSGAAAGASGRISFSERVAEYFVPSIRERRNLFEREINTDALCGIANRTAFNKAEAAAAADETIAFIVFDCNNFGRVNKEISFSAGDETLFAIANAIKLAGAAMNARTFRIGGDEFVVLVDRKRALFLRDAIEKRVGVFNFGSFKVSISGAIGNTFDEADALLQARKAERKRSTFIFD